MDFIKQWTLNICTTIIIATIISVCAPKGNFTKVIKMAVGLFILLSFLYPFTTDIDLSFPEFEPMLIEEEQAEFYQNTTTGNIEKALVNGGYDNCVVATDLKFVSDEIYIDKIEVSIPDAYDKEEVRAYIYDNLGFAAEVYYLGE